jgi:hypothetical protein
MSGPCCNSERYLSRVFFLSIFLKFYFSRLQKLTDKLQGLCKACKSQDIVELQHATANGIREQAWTKTPQGGACPHE